MGRGPRGGAGGEPGPCPEIRVLTATTGRPALAAKHMDLKNAELDTAAAKVDELTKQLESLWSDLPAASLGSQARAPARVSLLALVPTRAPKVRFFPPGVQASLSHGAVQAVGYLKLLVGLVEVGISGSGRLSGPSEEKGFFLSGTKAQYM